MYTIYVQESQREGGGNVSYHYIHIPTFLDPSYNICRNTEQELMWSGGQWAYACSIVYTTPTSSLLSQYQLKVVWPQLHYHPRLPPPSQPPAPPSLVELVVRQHPWLTPQVRYVPCQVQLLKWLVNKCNKYRKYTFLYTSMKRAHTWSTALSNNQEAYSNRVVEVGPYTQPPIRLVEEGPLGMDRDHLYSL